MIGVAEGAAQVATREAHEHCGRAREKALALEGIKDFANKQLLETFCWLK